MSPVYCDTLKDIDWPDDAVFVVDDALPGDIIAPLPGPTLEVRAGEDLKTLDRVGTLADALLDVRSSRPLTVVAVGGGAVGDAAGFLASILWRGVRLWHVPSTLVAMVDSAHGGKTAVNLGGRKNQLGTFYVADNVVICQAFLNTLPLDLREEGLTELIKGLWLARPDILERFDDRATYGQILGGDVDANSELWTEIIDAAIDAKAGIVDQDPHEETGLRRILNLGHTAGHGLEALYGLPHGRAVAWGLAACAHLSVEYAGLSKEEARRLLAHVDPLIVAPTATVQPGEKEQFLACLGRDKKQEDGELISILVDGPGAPTQTKEISPKQWWNAVGKAYDRWRSAPLRLTAPRQIRRHDIALPPDKSRANRAATIAYLRPAPTTVDMTSSMPPADIADLRGALELLAHRPPDASVTVSTGEGGTTSRFLLALAATRPGPTTLRLGAGLQNRPQGPLVQALQSAGATVEATDDGFQVRGWDEFPKLMTVDACTSSQFASALALLAASGHEFRLQIDGEMVSRPYFELTLNLLREVGVAVEVISDQLYGFSPGPGFASAVQMDIPFDTSSAVVWRAIEAVRNDLTAPPFPDIDHPDDIFDELAQRLVDAGDEHITVDLSEAPDTAPVLCALACLLPVGLTVTGAPHLRHKESDRIEDLAASFSEVGVDVDTRPDGFVVASGSQNPDADAVFDPRGDHRLAMAALVLASTGTPLVVSDARCVFKSYPDLWRQARRCGFEVSQPTA